MTNNRSETDLDDHLSLAEFVALWWADEAPGSEDGEVTEDLRRFLDRKQASLRMLRRNRPGFPKPTDSAGRTLLFRLGDLVSWISGPESDDESTLAQLERRLARVAPLWRFRRALEACRRELDAESSRRLAVGTTLALHCLGTRPGLEQQPLAVQKLTSAGLVTAKLLRFEAAEIESRVPELQGVFGRLFNGIPARLRNANRLVQCVLDVIESGISAVRLVDLTLGYLSPSPALGGGSAQTASGLARLMVAAGDPQPGERILDLAAGEGGLLLCAAEESGGSPRLAGIEPDPSGWAIAKSRFYLRGLEVDLRLGKSLDGDEPLPGADLILVDPPLESRRSYRKWLSLAARCIESGGRAVVTLPAVSLEPSRREWQDIGTKYAGVVITGPNRLRSDHGETLALWVLDAHKEDQILMVDASKLGRQRGALNDVTPQEADLLRRTVRIWRREGLVEAPTPVSALKMSRYGAAHYDSIVSEKRSSLPDRRGHIGDASSELRDALREARDLTARLKTLVTGPLQSYTSEEHRRALKRLLGRLNGYIERDRE